MIKDVESCLELILGMSDTKGIQSVDIEKTDYNFMYSVAKQIHRGLALTDRQHSTTKEKLLKYETFFVINGIDVQPLLDNTRLPIRTIDRTKSITYIETFDRWPAIKVRFPFSKKLIVKIGNLQHLVHNDQYYHEKGTHEHFFELTENNLYRVLNVLMPNNFEIDNELLALYKTVSQIVDNKSEHVPGVYGYELKNFHDIANQEITKTLGKPANNNYFRFADRAEFYGIHHIDQDILESSLNQCNILSQKIISRKTNHVHIPRTDYNLNTMIDSIIELDRFPLLIILSDNTAEEFLSKTYDLLKSIVPTEDISVLFRLDNTNYKSFNDYVRDKNLNNPVDTNTKVVYINNEKLPKPFIKSKCVSVASLLFEGKRLHTDINTFIDQCDLNMYYAEDISPFMTYSFNKVSILQ